MPEPRKAPEDAPAGPARRTLVKGGTVVETTADGVRVRRADVMIEDGRVVAIEETIDATGTRDVVDAGGCIVGPGLVDLHTHLREPGNERAETIETGTRAAALGGFTAVVAMPDTEPTIDSASAVRFVQEAARAASCDVAVAGAITVGRKGELLAPIGEMAGLGVRLFTDNEAGVQDAGLLRRALEYTKSYGVTLAQHCEDAELAGGAMHEGAVSAELGMPGIPAEAEEVMIMRDLALVRLTGGRLHLLHLSTAGSVALVRAAKGHGLAVTAEATPHHFTLTDETVRSFDPVFRSSPPLRGLHHRDAIRGALVDGTIDAIATDHAPWAPETKELPFDQAPCGMLGLETALSLALTELRLPVEQVFALMSTRPAQIAHLDEAHGVLAVGRPANITAIDPTAEWTVEPTLLASRSRNTPYAGRRLTGRVRHTFLRGEATVLDGEAQR